jgi:serine/threonine-protein kinase
MTVLVSLFTLAALAAAGLRLALLAARRSASGWLERALTRSSRRVGPYRLERKLGEGGSGDVYRARNASAGGALAIKLSRPGASARQQRRFEREAGLGAELRHPNAAAIYGGGECEDGTRYVAMELVEGDTLRQLVERDGPLPPARVIRIARQLCSVLSHLHERGLVHRDIKPENVIVERGGRGAVKLIDFGLAEPIGAVLEPDVIAGTPLYISPEALLTPGSVDARSDLYALGALMYFMLRGVPVFGGRSPIEVCMHHLHTPPEAPSAALGAAIPPALDALILDCLAKAVEARPPSARVVGERLAACQPRARACRPRAPAAASCGCTSPGRRGRGGRLPARAPAQVASGRGLGGAAAAPA